MMSIKLYVRLLFSILYFCYQFVIKQNYYMNDYATLNFSTFLTEKSGGSTVFFIVEPQ